jgi:hypothetical protein
MRRFWTFCGYICFGRPGGARVAGSLTVFGFRKAAKAPLQAACSSILRAAMPRWAWVCPLLMMFHPIVFNLRAMLTAFFPLTTSCLIPVTRSSARLTPSCPLLLAYSYFHASVCCSARRRLSRSWLVVASSGGNDGAPPAGSHGHFPTGV